LRGSIGSEFSQRGLGDEMALKIEGVVDGGMHTQEALRGARRLESLHLALSPSHRLMRVLGSIAGTPTPSRLRKKSVGGASTPIRRLLPLRNPLI